MALAYPDTVHSQLGQAIARDHFITALNDRELAMKIRDRDPTDLESAYRNAIRVETYLNAYDNDIRKWASKSDKTVGNNKLTGKADASNVAMTQLCAQSERTQHEKDESAKEVGRLKLLAEQSKASNAPFQPREPLVSMQSKFHIKPDRPNVQRFHSELKDNRIC